MGMEPSNLTLFWAGAIALSIIIYVILDGFDLGVGVLFGTTNEDTKRVQMMNAIAPFWDGNETWLVIIGASLFAAFRSSMPFSSALFTCRCYCCCSV
jgi:cytochrome d ubiquinol oxidase subunit II